MEFLIKKKKKMRLKCCYYTQNVGEKVGVGERVKTRNLIVTQNQIIMEKFGIQMKKYNKTRKSVSE